MVGFRGEISIKIGGKKRLLKFGTNQTAILSDLYDAPLQQMDEVFSPAKMSIGQTRDMIYSALAAGCYSSKKEIDFDQYDVGDWIDEISQADLESIFKAAFTEGEAKKKPASRGKTS